MVRESPTDWCGAHCCWLDGADELIIGSAGDSGGRPNESVLRKGPSSGMGENVERLGECWLGKGYPPVEPEA